MAGAFNSGTLSKLQKFGSLIERFREQIANENAYDAAVIIARSSGIIDDLSKDETPEGVSRKENIQELLNGIKDFSETAYKEGKDDKLPAFLEGVALLTDQDGDKEGDQNKVTLMTIHASKGLEFSNVFITGLEEELFPAQQCVTTPAALEEERRLFYVALTRAEKRLSCRSPLPVTKTAKWYPPGLPVLSVRSIRNSSKDISRCGKNPQVSN